jgi:uncharacterized protein YjaG (DUF416 family)
MDDREVLSRISELVREEHRLYEHSTAGRGLSQEDQERLRAVEVALDQCWDLLRQRRARREFGSDPAEAEARDPSVVKGYRQ